MECRIERRRQFCIAIVNVLENDLAFKVVQDSLGIAAVKKVRGNWVLGG